MTNKQEEIADRLFVAVRNGNISALQELLSQYPAGVNATDYNRYSLLMIAV